MTGILPRVFSGKPQYSGMIGDRESYLQLRLRYEIERDIDACSLNPGVPEIYTTKRLFVSLFALRYHVIAAA